VLDALASEGMFQKHYRTLALMGADTLSFAHPPSTYWSEGIVSLGGVDVGVPAHASARFLVTLYWPWVTSVRVTARPLAGPATLTIRSGSFFRRRALGQATFSTHETVEIPVASGAFDSGINEVLLSSDAPIALESWQWVDVAPHDTTTRLFKEK